MKKFKKILALCLSIMIMASSFTVAFAQTEGNQMSSAELDTVRLLGIINGDENGNLNLDKNVTRAEFVKMALAASIYKDSIADESNMSVFSDVASSHWASNYIKKAVDLTWVSGYLDGSFKPNNNITMEEAATVVLKILGYQSSDLSGSFPYAQISKFNSLDLNQNLQAEKGDLITREDCVHIFYNLLKTKSKTGSIYGMTLGVAYDTQGEIDFNLMLNSEMSDGHVYKSNLNDMIPFSFSNINVYRDGVKTDINSIEQYDVVYYCENLRTIYSYSKKVFGNIEGFPGSNIYPDSINVAGNTYKISSQTTSRKIVNEGTYNKGDQVVLLLGRNDDVIDVEYISSMNLEKVGVVTEASNKIIDGAVKHSINTMMMDGTSSSYTVDSGYKIGDVIKVAIKDGDIIVNKIYNVSKQVKSSDLASNVEILDVYENQSKVIYKSRLENLDFDSSFVKFYSQNSEGKIDQLILNNYTRDFDTYGIVTEKQEISYGLNLSSQYSVLVKGNMITLGSNNAIYNVDNVPVVIRKIDGKLDTINELIEYKIDNLNDISASSKGINLKYADDMQVYIYGNGNYQLTTLSQLTKSNDLSISAYVNPNANISNEIRIIIAR